MWSPPRRYRSRRWTVRTRMPVASFSATSRTKRASCRDGESFSPPTLRRSSASSAVSAVGTPSANSRTVYGSREPSSAVELPTMSSVNMARTRAPSRRSDSARCAAPYSPCSSPATAANTSVAAGRRRAITRTSSRTTATPEASSSAPGASLSASMTSLARES